MKRRNLIDSDLVEFQIDLETAWVGYLESVVEGYRICIFNLELQIEILRIESSVCCISSAEFEVLFLQMTTYLAVVQSLEHQIDLLNQKIKKGKR